MVFTYKYNDILKVYEISREGKVIHSITCTEDEIKSFTEYLNKLHAAWSKPAIFKELPPKTES